MNEYGLDLTGWTLDDALAVSADGNVIVGQGWNPSGEVEAWMAALSTACDNGTDDDGDGHIDFAADPGCASASDLSERSSTLPCDDGVDNDGDGLTDFPTDPACQTANFTREKARCQDGLDNDSQTGIDFDGGASVNGGVPLDVPDPWLAPLREPRGRRGRARRGPGADLRRAAFRF